MAALSISLVICNSGFIYNPDLTQARRAGSVFFFHECKEGIVPVKVDDFDSDQQISPFQSEASSIQKSSAHNHDSHQQWLHFRCK